MQHTFALRGLHPSTIIGGGVGVGRRSFIVFVGSTLSTGLLCFGMWTPVAMASTTASTHNISLAITDDLHIAEERKVTYVYN